MKKVLAYKTSDGVIYESIDTAINQEKLSYVLPALKVLLQEKLGITNEAKLVEYSTKIIEYRDDFLTLLNKLNKKILT